MSGQRIRIADPGDGRLYVKWWVDDYARFLRIKDNFKESFTKDAGRGYDDTTKWWSVPQSQSWRLEAWVNRWFDAEAQQWDEDEAEAAGYGRTYAGSDGYGRYREPQTSTSTIAAAFAQLHLLPSAPAWAAEAVYRAAVKAHHPDRGGDTQVMTRINLAMQLIRAQTEEKAS